MNPATAPESTFDTGEDCFVAVISDACNRSDARSAGWQIMPEVDRPSEWIYVRNENTTPPEQGWKLHVSANVMSARDVLERILAVLLKDDAHFKVLSSKSTLVQLNNGFLGPSQVGKFVTVYPNNDDQAIRLATALDAATNGLAGPSIPSDRPLAPGSLVHYRYGGFSDRQVQIPIGVILPAILRPDGVLVPDERRTLFSPPDWATDPFEAAGVVTEPPEWKPLVADRFLLMSVLSSSPRHILYLAVDVAQPGSCVLKCARKGTGVDRFGRDSVESLRLEADILIRLAPDSRFPRVIDLVEDGDQLYLAVNEVQGETLAQHIANLGKTGEFVAGEQVVTWGLELASMLETLHAAGVIYRDLKSSNVIVTSDGHLRLIDFELAHESGMESEPYGYGTRGYMSPQQNRGEQPTPADDVYSLGALLYLVATGAEPSVAPNESSLLDRPVRLLNPAIGPELEDVINRCLHVEPAARFADAAAVQPALRDVQNPSVPSPPLGGEFLPQSEAEFRRSRSDMARRLGDTLCAEVRRPESSTGAFWISSHQISGGIPARDLNTGTGGTLLALAEIVAEFGVAEHANVLADGAHWLVDAPRPGGAPLPGLYAGEAGVGAALLRCGQVLNDGRLLDAATERGRMVAKLPFASPDLFNGTAGRLRFHLFLWDETEDSEQLNAAIAAGETLLELAEYGSSGEWWWTIPDGYANLSGKALLGYAHGAAGVGDTLLDLFETTGDGRFLESAQATARWLAPQAVPALDDDSGLNWPSAENDLSGPAFWCHGGAGIGCFFLHLAELDAFPDAGIIADRAARMVARGTRQAGPIQCHGLAGNIEFLLDVYQLTGNRAYLSEAQSLARLLEAFATERDGLLVWPSEQPTTFTPDYMVGYAGIAVCLLRLGEPDHRPHQLSRRGFRYGLTQKATRSVA